MLKVNLIIPTYNRPSYLRGLLAYYQQYGKDFGIMVADSSSEEYKAKNKEVIRSFPDLNIQYFDGYAKDLNPHHKFAQVIQHATAPYSVFCADDDFIIPNGIRQAVSFLENNADVSVAHGRYIGFRLEDKGAEKKKCDWTMMYPQESILSADPAERLFRHLSEYRLQTLYAVHRTDLAKKSYQGLLDSGVDPVLFGEMLPGMLDVIYGKAMCLDILYAARRIDSHVGGNWADPVDFMKEGRYETEYQKFKDCLVSELSAAKVSATTEEFKKLVDEAMAGYLKKYYHTPFNGFFKNKAQDNAVVRAGYRLARPVYRFLRNLFRSATGKTLVFTADGLEQYGDDFTTIRDYIIAAERG